MEGAYVFSCVLDFDRETRSRQDHVDARTDKVGRRVGDSDFEGHDGLPLVLHEHLGPQVAILAPAELEDLALEDQLLGSGPVLGQDFLRGPYQLIRNT